MVVYCDHWSLPRFPVGTLVILAAFVMWKRNPGVWRVRFTAVVVGAEALLRADASRSVIAILSLLSGWTGCPACGIRDFRIAVVNIGGPLWLTGPLCLRFCAAVGLCIWPIEVRSLGRLLHTLLLYRLARSMDFGALSERLLLESMTWTAVAGCPLCCPFSPLDLSGQAVLRCPCAPLFCWSCKTILARRTALKRRRASWSSTLALRDLC